MAIAVKAKKWRSNARGCDRPQQEIVALTYVLSSGMPAENFMFQQVLWRNAAIGAG